MAFWPLTSASLRTQQTPLHLRAGNPKKRKSSCQTGFLISPVFRHMVGIRGSLRGGDPAAQSAEIGLLEGGVKWCKISRGNIRWFREKSEHRKKKKHVSSPGRSRQLPHSTDLNRNMTLKEYLQKSCSHNVRFLSFALSCGRAFHMKHWCKTALPSINKTSFNTKHSISHCMFRY